VLSKRGQAAPRQVMIFSFILLLIIIGGGLVAGMFLFFGAGYDTRQVEADTLNYAIKDCILKSETDFSSKEALYQDCRLNEEIFAEGNLLRVKICVNSGDCIEEIKPELQIGSDFVVCGLVAAETNKAFPRCKISSFLKNDNKIDLITVSDRFNRRSKVG